MIKAKYYVLLICTLFISSCEYYMVVPGRVFSKESKLPLEGAIIEVLGRKDAVRSDKNGFFTVSKFGGGQPEIQVKVTQNNYKPFEITLKGGKQSSIYEVKEEFYFVNYDQPFYPDSSNRKTFWVGTSIAKNSKDFAVSSDTFSFYLDTINEKRDIEKIKEQEIRSSPHRRR